MLVIEERGQKFWTSVSYEFFQSIQFSLLQFKKVKTAVCNTEKVSI